MTYGCPLHLHRCTTHRSAHSSKTCRQAPEQAIILSYSSAPPPPPTPTHAGVGPDTKGSEYIYHKQTPATPPFSADGYGCIHVYQGFHLNHAQTARFNRPTFLLCCQTMSSQPVVGLAGAPSTLIHSFLTIHVKEKLPKVKISKRCPFFG